MSMVMFKQTKSDHSCYQRDQWITLYTICVLNLTQQDKTLFQRQHAVQQAAGIFKLDPVCKADVDCSDISIQFQFSIKPKSWITNARITLYLNSNGSWPSYKL